MDPNIKKEIRKEMRTRLATVTRAEQRDAARDLYRNLVGWPQLELFRSLLSFCSFGGELDPEMINTHWLQEGRHLSMTRVGDDVITLEIREVRTLSAIITGYKDIPEPDPMVCPLVSPGKVEVVLVPGLAFDITGTRLGRGKGHYDRLLERLPQETRRIGIAWDWQVRLGDGELLPREPHDAVMDYLCTPTSLIRCEPGRKG